MLLATRQKRTDPALTPARKAGTWFTYPGGMEGWVDLDGWLHTEMVYSTVTRHNLQIVNFLQIILNSAFDHLVQLKARFALFRQRVLDEP